jgi:hypothetical protein
MSRIHPIAGTPPSLAGEASSGVKTVGALAATWSAGFAALNAWQLTTGRFPGTEYPGYATALTVMSAVVLVLKLLGAGLALASLRAVERRRRWALAAALWGATSTLGLYSAGNVVITVGTVSGMIAPSPAWQAAGGLTLRAAGYVLVFLIGTALYAVLAVSFEQRHGRQSTALATGAIGGPVLLGGLLGAAPALLQAAGLMPSV